MLLLDPHLLLLLQSLMVQYLQHRHQAPLDLVDQSVLVLLLVLFLLQAPLDLVDQCFLELQFLQ
jgi:hypothetical protein